MSNLEIGPFCNEIQYRVTSELVEMLKTAQDWIDEADDGVFVAYRDALVAELAERDIEIATGEQHV